MTDIVIVSYRDKPQLDECIASVGEHCRDYNLIVEDNNQDNRGYSKAVNDGIRKGSAPFVWLLNSDALVLPGAQQGLLDRFAQDPRIGVVGSMQLDPEDRDIVRHGGTLAAFPAGSHAGGRLSMGHCLIPSRQKWVNFASVAIRRAMSEEIGLLDESMFLLYSDSDYCYHARRSGWQVWYEPSSRVVHRLGGASKGASEWHAKDMRAFMLKWGIEAVPAPGGQMRFGYSREFAALDLFP